MEVDIELKKLKEGPTSVTIYYATPKHKIPRFMGKMTWYYYAVDVMNNEVRGLDLNMVVRLACAKLGRIVNVGRVG